MKTHVMMKGDVWLRCFTEMSISALDFSLKNQIIFQIKKVLKKTIKFSDFLKENLPLIK